MPIACAPLRKNWWRCNRICSVGQSTPVTAALQHETKTIPIVFVIVSDPVGSGFVASLPRPGGNITGFINIEASLSGKWIEMLKEIVPQVTRAALLFNPQTAPYFAFYQQPFEAAARSNGIEPIAAPVHSAADIERVFENSRRPARYRCHFAAGHLYNNQNQSRSDHFAWRACPCADDLSLSVHGGRRWPDFLWNR